MDLFLEIILWIILTPLLEVVITYIIDKIQKSVKFRHFEEEYKNAVDGRNEEDFLMLLNPTIKKRYLLGIFSFIWLLILVDLITILSYFLAEANIIVVLTIILSFQIICLPFITIFINKLTEKINFTKDKIFYNSIFRKDVILVDKISSVEEFEKVYQPSLKGPVTKLSNAIILIYNNKKYQITSNYSNYGNAVTYFEKHELLY